jgi:hypothetical protein
MQGISCLAEKLLASLEGLCSMELVIIISFMQDIYTYIPETNHVSREYSVAAIL